MPLLEVDELTVRFDTPDGVVTAVDGLSFELDRGQMLGIVGESGCGKSSLVKGLIGLEPLTDGNMRRFSGHEQVPWYLTFSPDGGELVSASYDERIRIWDVATGKKVWEFELSLRGLNSSVVVHGGRVYAAHSEENVDDPGVMGRVVALDGTGRGDITKTAEIWRTNGQGVGFASPTAVDGRLYLLGNSADLHVLDLKTGEPLSSLNIGNIGRAALTYGDGKLFATEQNGNIFILEPGPAGVKVLEAHLADVSEMLGALDLEF